MSFARPLDDRPLNLAFLAEAKSIHTARWLNFYAGRGHAVSLLIDDDEPVSPDLDVRVQLRRYHPFHPTKIPMATSLSSRRSLRGVLRSVKPDVLHAHQVVRPGWQARLSGFHPYVVTPWGSDVLVGAQRSRRIGLLTRLSLGGADLVTAHSAQLAAAVASFGVDPSRIQRIQFGVDTTTFSPGLPDSSNLGALGAHVGRIVFSPRGVRPVYRQELVITALKWLPSDVIVVIPGQGGDEAALRGLHDLATGLGVADRVRILGQASEPMMVSLYRVASAVVSVPQSDGLPTTVLEAMACGAPLVISDLPGPKEALTGVPHFTVASADPAELAETIQLALRLDAEARRTLAETARGRAVDLYERRTNMHAMEALYRALRSQRSGPKAS